MGKTRFCLASGEFFELGELLLFQFLRWQFIDFDPIVAVPVNLVFMTKIFR